MANSPVPGPRSPWRDWDELIAVFVAFGAIGAIIFWGIGRQSNSWNWLAGAAPSVSEASPTPGASLLPNLLSPGNGLALDRPERTPVRLNSPAARVAPQMATPAPALGVFPRGTAVSPLPTAIGPEIAPAVTAPAVTVPAVTAPPGTISPGTVPPVRTEGGAPAVIPPVAAPSPSPAGVASPTAPAVVIIRPTTPPTSFPDVPQGYWAAPFILGLSQRGAALATVEGTFQPDRPATRVEYATELEKVFRPTTPQPSISFQDVPAGYPAIAAIDTAVKSGFMKGYAEGLFRPDQPMPRYQVLLSLVNGLGLPVPADAAAVVNTYTDGSQVPAWAVPGVAAAAQAGLVVNPNDGRSLEPNRPVTRAELAAMMYQALVAAGQAQPVESGAIARPQ